MRLSTTLLRRNLLRRPGRTLFSALGIALGVATVVAVSTLDHNTIEGLKLRYEADWRPELEVRPSPELSDPRAALDSTPGVAGATAFFQAEVLARDADAPQPARGERTPAARPARARLVAVEAGALVGMDAYRLLAGEDLDPEAREPELLLGAALARALDVAPGDRVELSTPPRVARRECVDGVLRAVEDPAREAPVAVAFRVRGVLAPERLGRRAEGEVCVCDIAWGRTLFRDARVDERYWVRPDPVVDLERLQASLAGSFAYDIGRSVVVGRAADERAFRNGVLMAGLLALVLGLYVIFHTLSTSLVERVVEIGTLDALGTTRGQIARALLLEAAALAGIGGALGLGLGLLVARLLLARGITTLGSGVHVEGFRVPWGPTLALTALGAAVALAGSVFPLLRAQGMRTVDALRGERTLRTSDAGRGFHLFAAVLLAGILPSLYFVITGVVGDATRLLVGATLLGVGVLALLVAVPFVVPRVVRPLVGALAAPLTRAMPFSGRLAARTMSADPRRVAVSAAAIALVAAALVGLKGMTRSLAGEIEEWSGSAIADKVFVEELPGVSFEALAARLHELPEVVAVEPGSARVYSPFLMLGARTAELRRHGPLAADPALARAFEQRPSVILSGRLARNLAYEVGDRVQVSTGGGVRELRVIAISDDYGYFPRPDERMYGVVSDRWLQQLFCLDVETVDRVAVRLAPGGDPGAVVAVVQSFVGGEAGLRFELGRDLRDRQVVDIARDFRLFDVLLALTALLAAVGVLNGQLLAALERERELGVLRALGATRAQIAGSVLAESAVIGLVGGALGTGIGALLGPVIVRALELLSGLALPARSAGVWLVVAPGAALLLTLFAALVPIWRMNRADPVRAVRTG